MVFPLLSCTGMVVLLCDCLEMTGAPGFDLQYLFISMTQVSEHTIFLLFKACDQFWKIPVFNECKIT